MRPASCGAPKQKVLLACCRPDLISKQLVVSNCGGLFFVYSQGITRFADLSLASSNSFTNGDTSDGPLLSLDFWQGVEEFKSRHHIRQKQVTDATDLSTVPGDVLGMDHYYSPKSSGSNRRARERPT